MSERSDLITRLLEERDFRSSYFRGKLNVLISAQIYALRKKFFGTQKALADASGMKQSRISAMERPGFTKFNLETLIRLAATFKVGLMVKFVPYSEALKWDNTFIQDEFNVIQLDKDIEFLMPTEEPVEEKPTEIGYGKPFLRPWEEKLRQERRSGLQDNLKEVLKSCPTKSSINEGSVLTAAGR